MDAKDQGRWTRPNAKDTVLNGLLAAALASLILHAVSGGTVDVPVDHQPEAVVNDTPLEYPFA
ncbi:MAG TPA: hypothetical protein VFP44_25045 [Usitatibacter sp.]|nr:hypothetical protein [Usitatibacter sp.]